ncbi:MAG: hypothetical protein SGCHY_005297, partial [Lobulomycetales sp.]
EFWLRISLLVNNVVFYTMCTAISATTIYCYSKMIWIVLSSSSKLAKMRRTAGKREVKTLELKIFSSIAVSSVLFSLMIADIMIFRWMTFMPILCSFLAYIILHLLEVMRNGIATMKEESIELTGTDIVTTGLIASDISYPSADAENSIIKANEDQQNSTA